ncbi:MAG: transcription elongation factor GreA [Actinobacteria bacterium]|nr:transcription elongation factor GreA [Actinomycetota bacterium]
MATYRPPVHHLTATALERLRQEHDDLTTRGRIEVAAKIERARELGDLSENGDYHAAKDEQGHMEGRIRHLESILENYELVEIDDVDLVGPGKLVTVSIDGDAPETYYLGSHEEKYDGATTMTPESALGRALDGHRTNETVSYTTPNGHQLTVVVLRVELP